MPLDTKEKHILAAVDALQDDIIDFTRRLVAQPSTLGNEASVLALVENELERLGFQPERVPIDPETLGAHPGFAPVPWEYQGRYNIVAVQPPAGDGGRSALFNGHLDVVDPEPLDYWDHDPFDPVEREGRLFGRGAGDMKSGVAAMIYAARAIYRSGLRLKGPLTLETVIEEECSGNGALACLQAGYDGDAVLIPEPFGPTILTHQLGVLWFKVNVRGKPVHVYEAQAGTNAVEKSYLLIEALRELEEELNRSDVPPAYVDISHPLNLNIGIFKGGNWPSTVPAAAEFHGRLSFFPGVAFETIKEKIAKTIDRAARRDSWLAHNSPQLEFYGFRSEGHATSMDLPAFKVLNDCHQSLAGQTAEEYIATCTTDLRAFHFFGQGQATCYGPVGGNFHGTNEWVDIASIQAVARTYALFLARWCGLCE